MYRHTTHMRAKINFLIFQKVIRSHEEYDMTEETSTQIIEWNVNDQAIAEVAEKCKEVDAYKDLDTAKVYKGILQKAARKEGQKEYTDATPKAERVPGDGNYTGKEAPKIDELADFITNN